MTTLYYELELTVTHPDATPHYEYTFTNRSKHTTGFPLQCIRDVVVRAGEVASIPLGISARLLRVTEHAEPAPVHFWLLPTADMYEHNMMATNNVAVVQATSRQELCAAVTLLPGATTHTVRTGDALFQIVAPDIGWIKNVRTTTL